MDALPAIDFVLISHDHYDHADAESIAALARRGARFVVPLRLGEIVREAGGDAIELDWGESVEIAGVKVHCVPAQHFSGRWLDDQNRRLWAGFVVAILAPLAASLALAALGSTLRPAFAALGVVGLVNLGLSLGLLGALQRALGWLATIADPGAASEPEQR